jgi:hypothetical protein
MLESIYIIVKYSTVLALVIVGLWVSFQLFLAGTR